MPTIYQASEKRKRLKLLERAAADERPPLRLTKRDLAVIQAVYEYRALTTPQIEQLLFSPGKDTRCRKRLQRLYHHGYLWRDEQPTKLSQGRAPLVYRLDTNGVELLAELWGLERKDIDWRQSDNTLSDLFLNHLLRTNDVRLAIAVAAENHGFTIEEWLDDATLRKAQNKDYVTIPGTGEKEEKAALVPDGYFHLDTGSHDYHHFLEVDLRTVVGKSSRWGRRDWARKIRAYLAYYDSGQYQQRYETTSLRILTVTTGARRLKNLKEITERAGGRKRFWFTTFEELTPTTVFTEPIWQIAGRGNERHAFLW